MAAVASLRLPFRFLSIRMLSIAATALLALPSADAAEPDQFSDAERRVFTDAHLRGIDKAATLEYVYEKRGSIEPAVDDVAVVRVGPAAKDGSHTVKIDYLSGPRKMALPDVEHAQANPLIMFFLEREVREMNRLTHGSTNYYRKRIRLALAESAEVRDVQLTAGGRNVNATEVRIAPYRDDPARSRYEKFAERTYTIVLSPEVPGGVVELKGQLLEPGQNDATPAIIWSESVKFARKR